MTTDTGSSWALDENDWQALCDAIESATTVERPYEIIRIGGRSDGTLKAYVSEPFPEPNIPETDSDNDEIPEEWDWGEENKPTTLPEHVADPIRELLDELQTAAVNIVEDAPDVTIGVDTCVCTPDGTAAVFSIQRPLAVNEAGLHTQFKELMCILGHTDTPDTPSWGNGLAVQNDEFSDHKYDLGMMATAYRFVQNPHEYWRNCDTLADFIDMCVANGADREELEHREKYIHHFHPDTRFVELSDEQTQAISEWQTTTTDSIRVYLELGDVVLKHGVSDVWFSEDGSGAVVYSLTAGNDIYGEY